MTLSTHLEFFRQQETDLFSETLTVTRPGEGSYTAATQTYTAGGTSVYSGGGKIRVQRGVGYDLAVGGGDARLHALTLTLPADTAIAKNDTVTVSASEHDADLVGRTYRITDVLRDGWQITRKAMIEEVG